MKCPYCLDIEMQQAPELGKGWHKCPNCGATHNKFSRGASHFKTVDVEYDPLTGKTKYKPSASVAKRVKKVREG